MADGDAEEWLTMPEMAARHEEIGLGPISRTRLWDLAREDPNWPVPPEETRHVGRIPQFPWSVMEPYLRARERRQGERTDLRRDRGEAGEE